MASIIAETSGLGPVGEIAVGCAIVFMIGYLLWRMATSPLKIRTCDICGNPLNSSRHAWTIDGVDTRVCTHCNTRLARKNSAKKMKGL